MTNIKNDKQDPKPDKVEEPVSPLDALSWAKVGTNVEFISELPAELIDPNYHYHQVIGTYRHDPFRVQRLLQQGWDFVYSDIPEVDDRGSAFKMRGNARKSPLTVTRKSGHRSVWMKLPLDEWIKRQAAKAARNASKLIEAVSIRHTQQAIQVKGKDIIV